MMTARRVSSSPMLASLVSIQNHDSASRAAIRIDWTWTQPSRTDSSRLIME